jgi:hypothetical protein
MQQQQAASPRRDGFIVDDTVVTGVDYTKVPGKIDAKLNKLDRDGAVRPTKLIVGQSWHKTFYESLLSKASKVTLGEDELRTERSKAIDLLDALTKSGALPLEDAQLHVVNVVTHCFDKTLMRTVARDNINPIERVERTQLIIASVVHDVEDTNKLIRHQ